ncbi:hypothetical protein [Pseudanabaena sp. PCC 6802]|uniref:hypothetical protein n=1 Tax=Pseudanabaena sp. PCC 6802 TaxID=118173 RepID=UPI00034B4A60|nr:hypothetical protein [Pseudanabaena sp. PCC 6802]
MYTIELTLKRNPIALSVQRKDRESAESLYKLILSAISPNSNTVVLELTCDKQEDKKLAIITSEISAVQISEKTGASANLGAGFVRN